MTLIEAIRDLGSLDEESTLYASEPWTEDSVVIVASEPASGGLPAEAQTLGLNYFLEVSVAREVLEGWARSLGAEPTPKEVCARLIDYAISDA